MAWGRGEGRGGNSIPTDTENGNIKQQKRQNPLKTKTLLVI